MHIAILKDNIGWIKDILTIVFTGTITLVALFTYLRAKETLLQPVRSEVIKRQSELLMNLLEFITKDEASSGPDYLDLIHVNVHEGMVKYGFVIADQQNIEKKLNELVGGSVFFAKDNIITDLEVVQPFPSSSSENGKDKKQSESDRQDYEKAKAGDIQISWIFLTKKHQQYMRSLSAYANNPLLPSNVQKVLHKIADDINSNVTVVMKATLEDFFKDLFKKHCAVEGGWKGKISPIGVYNEFNHRRIHNDNDIARLSAEIRKYLKVDTMP